MIIPVLIMLRLNGRGLVRAARPLLIDCERPERAYSRLARILFL